MKTLPVLIAAALVAGFALLHAQQPAAPLGQPAESGTAAALPVDEGSLLPSAGSGLILYPSAAATPTPLPLQAVPEAASATPAAPAALAKGSAEQLRQAIRIRELKTQVLEDPEVQAQKEGARCAQTNAGRCVWMRNYYTLLYTKIEKIDPSLTEELEKQLHELLGRYEQHNVRPSVLIECVKELPGSHSADHASGEPSEKPDKKAAKKSKGPLKL